MTNSASTAVGFDLGHLDLWRVCLGLLQYRRLREGRCRRCRQRSTNWCAVFETFKGQGVVPLALGGASTSGQHLLASLAYTEG